jgi:hypothetical protein
MMYRNDPMGRLPWADSASAPIYVPIDCGKIADRLNADPGRIFGRLYYHLDYKYRYKQSNGSEVHLFAFMVGKQLRCINVPYLEGILAEKLDERRNVLRPRIITAASLAVSILSLIVAALALQAKGG